MSKLLVLEDVRRLIQHIYSLELPKSELYNLNSQVKRASVSIALNLREGNIFRDKNKVRFFRIALGSLSEVDECLILCLKLNYCNKNYYDEFKEKYYWVCFNKIARLINVIKEQYQK